MELQYSVSEGTTYREDVAISNHNFTAELYFNFTMQPGEICCLDIAIIDDNIAENQYESLSYAIGVYTTVPFHAHIGRIQIEDDDGK